MNIRTIKKTVKGSRTVDGAGVSLVRVIGMTDTDLFDPFLMLDAFDSTDPQNYIKGFPWHPHRGIETFTYLINGNIEHADSLGNKGTITDGQAQWMSAGSGIIHQEMPQAALRMLGLQCWINLPQYDKMSKPAYRDITKEDVITIEEENRTVRLISGNYHSILGRVLPAHVQTTIMDVELKKSASFSLETSPDVTVFIYVVSGKGKTGLDSAAFEDHCAVLFTDGEKVEINADGDLRFVLFAGARLNESIAWGGPIVMNTQEELRKAFAELREGTFIKK